MRVFSWGALAIVMASSMFPTSITPAHNAAQGTQHTATPIKHLVVLFQENISFDHYFGTYPHAANTDGNPFHAKRDTPRVNGLTNALLTHNPNEDNPERLTPSQAFTCSQDHGYTAEQQAFDGGLMDKSDPLAGSLDGMFDWRRPRFTRFILNPQTGEPVLH